MKIVNSETTDYHMHSSSYSDGTSTFDEIARFAWEIGLTEIAITDHSDIVAIKWFSKEWVHRWFSSRESILRWKNVFNDVNVIPGVEWDLLNEEGDICTTIQWIEPGFIIVSAHAWIYEWKPENITNAYINAIKKHHKKINLIWHPCNSKFFAKYLDMEKLIEVCNEYNIPMEFNACNLNKNITDMDKLHLMLQKANYVYVNSDAHSLYELKEVRKTAFQFLRDNNYM